MLCTLLRTALFQIGFSNVNSQNDTITISTYIWSAYFSLLRDGWDEDQERFGVREAAPSGCTAFENAWTSKFKMHMKRLFENVLKQIIGMVFKSRQRRSWSWFMLSKRHSSSWSTFSRSRSRSLKGLRLFRLLLLLVHFYMFRELIFNYKLFKVSKAVSATSSAASQVLGQERPEGILKWIFVFA